MLEPIEFKDFYLASNADVEDPGWTASQSCVGQQLLFLRIYLQRTLTSFQLYFLLSWPKFMNLTGMNLSDRNGHLDSFKVKLFFPIF